jgi:hypothetical protein
MKKWIPIYGMFTKEADDIPTQPGSGGAETSLMMVLYHILLFGGGLMYLIGYLILKP